MAFSDDSAMESRLGEFLNGRIGRHLARREQKESFAIYAHGILADGERKSVEPIAARATGRGAEDEQDEKAGAACERMQARLLNFLRDSPWDDRSVRREARYVIEAREKQEPARRPISTCGLTMPTMGRRRLRCAWRTSLRCTGRARRRRSGSIPAPAAVSRSPTFAARRSENASRYHRLRL